MGNFNLDVTLAKAIEDFQRCGIEDMAGKTGAEVSEGKLSLKYFNDMIEITYPEGMVTDQASGNELGIYDRILILHHLAYAKGSPMRKQFISYKELPGGSIYIEPFTNRCIKPLMYIFGHDLAGYQKASEAFLGKKESFGDVSYTFDVFPRVPITLVLWEGDEEFPPNANILFDASAEYYLHTEDYAHICGMLVSKLKKLK